jgi:thymidylate synthase (FAD)
MQKHPSGVDDSAAAEIAVARSHKASTRRPTVHAMEELLFRPIPVLDHGFIRIVDYMGDDSAVVQAARVSYGRGTRKVSEDKGLIMYLMRHNHSTPFEMAEIKLHVKLPIFVARQWIRHRTANVNEYSARYSLLDKEFYVPKAEHLGTQSATNRQGRAQAVGEEEAEQVLGLLRVDAERTYSNYLWMLNETDDGAQIDQHRLGIARELARINLTLNTYTQWYWKIDLHNLLRFLRLRADPHAQYEIRAYAEEILKVVSSWVPLTYDAFLEHQLHSVTLSRSAIAVVRRIISGEHVDATTSELSSREWRELQSLLSATFPPP